MKTDISIGGVTMTSLAQAANESSCYVFSSQQMACPLCGSLIPPLTPHGCTNKPVERKALPAPRKRARKAVR